VLVDDDAEEESFRVLTPEERALLLHEMQGNASERRGNNFKGLKDFYLKGKASIWS